MRHNPLPILVRIGAWPEGHYYLGVSRFTDEIESITQIELEGKFVVGWFGYRDDESYSVIQRDDTATERCNHKFSRGCIRRCDRDVHSRR